MTDIATHWRNGGDFETLEGCRKTIWIDNRETHPFRGVYLADRNAPIDVFGNPMGLREAPVGAFQAIARI